MFKKVLVVFIAVFAALTLTACKERTFKADGVYTAFKVDLSYGKPQLTTVDVTIKDDKIESFYIDCRQSAEAKDNDGNVTGYAFNEKTKKELQYLYGMHNTPNAEAGYTTQDLTTTEGMAAYKEYLEEEGLKEWFEQAALLEAHFKANGTTLETDKAGYITNVAGVTVADSNYSALAAEAVENAKEGKVVKVTQYLDRGVTNNVVWVEGTVNEKGEFTAIKIDTLQGKIVEGAFAWNEKSKQELQYLYGMHNTPNAEADYARQDLTTAEGMATYKEYLEEEGLKEWFEQADMLAAYVLANGVDGLDVDKSGKLSSAPTQLADVTVTVSHYLEVLEALFE